MSEFDPYKLEGFEPQVPADIQSAVKNALQEAGMHSAFSIGYEVKARTGNRELSDAVCNALSAQNYGPEQIPEADQVKSTIVKAVNQFYQSTPRDQE